MKKRKTLKTMKCRDLVKVLDKEFSLYVRLRAADDNGCCKCITCGKLFPYKEICNGHYIPRQYMSTRYNEINCNPQCTSCCTFFEGKHFIYRQRLVEMYGEEKIERMELWADMTKTETADTLREKIEYYRKLTVSVKENEQGGKYGYS